MANWEYAGKQNTDDTARSALARAEELGIAHFVVATNTGFTVDRLMEVKKEVWPQGQLNVVAVTHHAGFRNPGEDEMPPEKRSELQNAGIRVLTTTHLFANIERSITSEWGGLYPGGIVSMTLRTYGQGTKVCFEIATMAKDAGMIPHDEEVMVLGGSGGGADTALIMKPAHAKNFFETEVLEVVCRPRGRQRLP